MSALSPEAIRQARDIRGGNYDQELILRLAVDHYFENHREPPVLSIEEKAGFIEATKPERFAALANLIDIQMGLAQKGRTSSNPSGLSAGRRNPIEPWDDLSQRYLTTFKLYTDQLRQTPEFAYCQQINELMFDIGLNHISVEIQLDAGMRTAVDNNLPLIRALPRMIHHFAPQTPRESWSEIARRSSSLAYMMSRRSIEGLLGARKVINHSSENDIYDISKFAPVFSGEELVAVQFDNLDEQTVKAGTRIAKGYLDILSVAKDMKLGDLESTSGPTIGCPITLLNGRLREFWEWNVDCVVEARAWDSTY